MKAKANKNAQSQQERLLYFETQSYIFKINKNLKTSKDFENFLTKITSNVFGKKLLKCLVACQYWQSFTIMASKTYKSRLISLAITLQVYHYGNKID